MHLDDTSRNRRIGIALISMTTMCFASLDAVAKWLVQDLPVFQVVWRAGDGGRGGARDRCIS